MRAFTLKEEVRAYLTKGRHEVLDLGAYTVDPQDDYPDFAERVGDAISAGEAPRGILICGSGVGVCVAANKIPGIRAGMCHDTYSAHQGVEHDDMNVLVLGARIVGTSLAYELVECVSSTQNSSPTKSGLRDASRRYWPSKQSIRRKARSRSTRQFDRTRHCREPVSSVAAPLQRKSSR